MRAQGPFVEEPVNQVEESLLEDNSNERSSESDLQNISIDNLGYIENSEASDQKQENDEKMMNWSAENEELENNQNESPTLFSNEENSILNDNIEEKENENFSDTLISEDSSDDDLEIPAFLRKQKN